jgi:hypothetical protein
MKKSYIIIGGVVVLGAIGAYLYFKPKATSNEESTAQDTKTNSSTVTDPNLKEEKISIAVNAPSPVPATTSPQDILDLVEAKVLSKAIANEVKARAGVKKASSKAGADRAIADYTQKMAKLGYKPLADGGVEKI